MPLAGERVEDHGVERVEEAPARLGTRLAQHGEQEDERGDVEPQDEKPDRGRRVPHRGDGTKEEQHQRRIDGGHLRVVDPAPEGIPLRAQGIEQRRDALRDVIDVDLPSLFGHHFLNRDSRCSRKRC
jgi:hypothetical protein